MNILFLSIGKIDSIKIRGVTTDLLREFHSHGHCVHVASARERKYGLPTTDYWENGVNYLQIRTGNITKTNLLEKGISTLTLERKFLKAIKKYYKNTKFDLVLFTTPPVTFERVVRYVKKRDNARTYLLLKDIFPQNAVDLGMFSEHSVLYKYFRKKETKLYRISDYLGCMSPANVEFIRCNNSEIPSDTIEVCPNSAELVDISLTKEEMMQIRKQYDIPLEGVVFIYGGNLGKPQGIDFLIECVKSNASITHTFFVVAGSGTEYKKLGQFFEVEKPKNARLLPRLPKEEFDKLVVASDIGLIFLDRRFTIPNFPSRLLSYMQASIPVLAATDVNTDIGMIIEEGEFGFWCEHGDLQAFNSCVSKLMDPKLRKKMGANARRYLEAHYTARHSYEIIMKHFEK